MASVYLSLGSNLGNRKKNLEKAISFISEEAGKIISVSSFYQSEPQGFKSENDFLNAVILIETTLSPFELLAKTQEIEKKIGRKTKSTETYSDRIIDIDILFYDDLIVDTPELKIPHPLWKERDFVKIPLAELNEAVSKVKSNADDADNADLHRFYIANN